MSTPSKPSLCYDPQQSFSHAFVSYGWDPGVACLSYATAALWFLGYPDQALKQLHEARALAQTLSPHAATLGFPLYFAALLHQFRREGQAAREQAEAHVVLCNEQGLASWLVASGTIMLGWALVEQGQAEEGITQMQQGLAAYRATGAEVTQPYFLGLLAESYGKVGQEKEGLALLTEALTLVDKSGERMWETELYRLKGELTLQKLQVSGSTFPVETSLGSSVQSLESEAEECFWKAIEVARRQQAKSLELRAVMSLSRLWQSQGKQDEARRMLAEIYSWFTEGFDTRDLQDAKALLTQLS